MTPNKDNIFVDPAFKERMDQCKQLYKLTEKSEGSSGFSGICPKRKGDARTHTNMEILPRMQGTERASHSSGLGVQVRQQTLRSPRVRRQCSSVKEPPVTGWGGSSVYSAQIPEFYRLSTGRVRRAFSGNPFTQQGHCDWLKGTPNPVDLPITSEVTFHIQGQKLCLKPWKLNSKTHLPGRDPWRLPTQQESSGTLSD